MDPFIVVALIGLATHVLQNLIGGSIVAGTHLSDECTISVRRRSGSAPLKRDS